MPRAGGSMSGSHRSGGARPSGGLHISGGSRGTRPLGTSHRSEGAPRPGPSRQSRPPRPPRRKGRTSIFGGSSFAGPSRGISTGSGCCLLFFLPVLFIIAFLLFGVQALTGNDSDVSNEPVMTQSATTKREKLASSKCQETTYYKDDQNMIEDPARLQVGLKTFYKTTGVQPFVYFTKTSDLDMETAERTYDSLFSDDGHFLLLIHCIVDSTDTENWTAYYYLGSDANGIIDEDLLDQFWDYYDTNYYDNDLSTEEMLSNTFYQTAAVFSTDSSLFKSASQNGTGSYKVWIVLLVVVLILMLGVILMMRTNKKTVNSPHRDAPEPDIFAQMKAAEAEAEDEDDDIRTF